MNFTSIQTTRDWHLRQTDKFDLIIVQDDTCIQTTLEWRLLE